MTLTGRQLRDARFRAGLELRDLAARASVDPLQLAYAEAMYGAPPWSDDDFDRVQGALEAAGVEFIPENGGGAGVRLRRSPATQPSATSDHESRDDG